VKCNWNIASLVLFPSVLPGLTLGLCSLPEHLVLLYFYFLPFYLLSLSVCYFLPGHLVLLSVFKPFRSTWFYYIFILFLSTCYHCRFFISFQVIWSYSRFLNPPGGPDLTIYLFSSFLPAITLILYFLSDHLVLFHA
jgi:hypothetical protein